MVYPEPVLYTVLALMVMLFAYIAYQGYKVTTEKARKEAEKLAKAEKKRS
eukprot:CAMPEP_0173404420 /NCGR_PEP_ID=MMETSP1356-20130122/59308_1 /TAXON_ID=77927 ORGANISM="Hemiselmis virescens, Strain PCC157" /NCGR_SAMPLE_ID=MMETSP1356 /ASSEMBLY_ACC=CAM_ASM_000847 /LENGTH=49 /DNA_ID= /DNA_START= /DNA_END= /DNA_ORIENTATION=